VTIPTTDGVHRDIDETTYHGDRGSLSVTGAKLLLPPSCPAKFRAIMDAPPQPKPEYTFGSVVHKLVLGKGADITVIDAPDYRTKAAREERDQAHAEGKLPLLADAYEEARAMADAVLSDPVAGPLFEDGQAEVSAYHTDPETGVRLRGRADWLPENQPATIVDLKTSTTANPSELVRKFHSLGYHMQAAWYLDLFTAATGYVFDQFLFVVVEKEPPHVVQVVEWDEDALNEGRRLNRQAIRTFADCTETGHWPGYADGITTISLPPWAVKASADDAAAALIAELEEML